MVDVERAFGIRWQDWGRLAALGWVVMFVASWLALRLIWGGGDAGYRVLGVSLLLLAVLAGLPGAAALTAPQVKERLREMPEAAALGLLAVSACTGFACMIGVCGYLGYEPGMAAAVMLVGALAFPTTFRVVVPLAIPLACALKVWKDVRRDGAVSRLRYRTMWGTAAVGWLSVGVTGLVLAQA